MSKVAVGVVGLGYWGPNLARTFAALPDVELRWLCDRDHAIRTEMGLKYPGARVTADYERLLDDPDLDAVVIATPAVTHAELVRRALEANLHVFVEKPLALRGDDASDLAALAAERNRLLMTGHVLLFHPAVVKMKELIETGELGEVYYLYANRQNLGKVRRDENALWSLAPHDVSVLLYLLDSAPVEVSARGASYLRPDVHDVVFCYLRFESGVVAHLHVSWLDPHKLRKLTVVGSKRMAVFDDMEVERKLTVFDKAAIPPRTDAYGEYVQVRFGDISSPRLAPKEPLRAELEHFVAAVKSKGTLGVGTPGAVDVVGVLEALQRSLELDGSPVQVQSWARRRLRLAVPSAG